ncbi:MAG: PocR ligand-binding domain-containing protein [Clostridia bacterium]|nr:PocR ligand-binding domain-containing protein [Clostridia bacterium]
MILEINTEKLSKLIKSFYKLTKIKIAVYDDEFREVFCYPKTHTAFCTMINNTPGVCLKCQQSNEIWCSACKEKDALVRFTCHAGLTEVVAPLKEGDKTIGYIMFGQITDIKDKKKFRERAFERCKDYPLDFDEFEEKIKSVQYKSEEEIEAVSNMLNTFVSYIYLEGIVVLREEGRAKRIIEFIDKNLDDDLSISVLCEKLSVSRTVLYEITRPVMADGIAAYIRGRRIERAKDLIKNTEKTIEEISGMVGFMDSNYFRRVFKKTVGVSAKNWRNKMEGKTEKK